MTFDGTDQVENAHLYDEDGICERKCLGCDLDCGASKDDDTAEEPCYGIVEGICYSDDSCCDDCCCEGAEDCECGEEW